MRWLTRHTHRRINDFLNIDINKGEKTLKLYAELSDQRDKNKKYDHIYHIGHIDKIHTCIYSYLSAYLSPRTTSEQLAPNCHQQEHHQDFLSISWVALSYNQSTIPQLQNLKPCMKKSYVYIYESYLPMKLCAVCPLATP